MLRSKIVWRPAQRIRFAASAGHPPSAAEAAASWLYAPIDVGPVSLAQRTWVPAMVPWRATEEGYVTDEIDQVASEFKQKGAEILRENRDDTGKLTTIFVKDPNGLELEIRSPR